MYNKSEDSPVASGGLQSFITKKLKNNNYNQESISGSLFKKLRALYGGSASLNIPIPQRSQEYAEEYDIFQWLPVDLKLYIFSFLDAKSLCNACCVNQQWSKLTCDKLLWQHRLESDWRTWTTISYITNPQMYTDIECDWSLKDIYLRCSPDFQRQLHQANTTFHQVASVLKYLIPKKIPKAAMFGPGLETSTSGLVRQMIYEDNHIFSRVAMFPGQFDGFGGGMTLKIGSGHSIHLSVLYAASKRERENHGDQNRLQRNKMLQVHAGEEMDTDGDPEYELKPQMKHLCQTLDAFIFVVDASDSEETIVSARPELKVMLKEKRLDSNIPLLVLSCVKDDTKPRLPAKNVVELLQLSSFSQPWMVIDCITDTLAHVEDGVKWLIDQAQNR